MMYLFSWMIKFSSRWYPFSWCDYLVSLFIIIIIVIIVIVVVVVVVVVFVVVLLLLIIIIIPPFPLIFFFFFLFLFFFFFFFLFLFLSLEINSLGSLLYVYYVFFPHITIIGINVFLILTFSVLTGSSFTWD